MSNESPGTLALVTLAVMAIAAVFGLMGMAIAPQFGQKFWLFFIALVEIMGLVVLGVAGASALRERLGI